MQRGYARHFVHYVYDINIESNVTTALICHVDGKRPSAVCGRSVIRGLMRHVQFSLRATLLRRRD